MKVLHIVRHLHELSGVSAGCTETCDAIVHDRGEVKIAVKNLGDVNQLSRHSALFSCRPKMLSEGRVRIAHVHNLWTPVLHQALCISTGNQEELP